MQAGLVAFDREHVERATAGEVVGVAVLGAQRIGSDDHAGDVERPSSGANAVISLLLPSPPVWPHDHPTCLVEHRKQMYRPAVWSAGSTSALAVDGNHPDHRCRGRCTDRVTSQAEMA